MTVAQFNTYIRDNMLAIFPGGEGGTNVAHAGGNFTVPSGSITIASGDQVTFRYQRIGKHLFVKLDINTGTITGTPAYISVAIPGGYTSAAIDQSGTHWYLDNATYGVGLALILASTTTMRFYVVNTGNWQAQTDLLRIRAELCFEVA